MKPEQIPAPTIQRLSLYLRHLENCASQGVRTISSKQLGETLNLTDAQVRKDLAHFGPFGHPGIGYRVSELILRIKQILGTDRTWQVVVVGAGNLGRALAAYGGFIRKGFELVAVLDSDQGKVGSALAGPESIRVRHLDELKDIVAEHDVRLGILAVPAPSAQSVAEVMIEAGIKGILNFAPVSLNLQADVSVSGVDLAFHLEQLSYRVGGEDRVPLP